MQAADFALDHGITEQDATQRLRWQYESQTLTDQLPIMLGDAYAGHWFDHDDGGRLKIAVAADPVPPAFVASLRQHAAQHFTDIVQVGNSLRDLSTTATLLLTAANARRAHDRCRHPSVRQ